MKNSAVMAPEAWHSPFWFPWSWTCTLPSPPVFWNLPIPLPAWDSKLHAAAGIALPLESAETVSEETRYEKGLAIQSPIYGDEIAQKYAWLPDGFAEAIPKWLTELCFADFSTRKGLDEKTRELLTVVMLAAMGGAEVQVRSHVCGAIKVGNTAEQVVCAIAHAMPYMGVPRAFNALNCTKEILIKGE